MAGVDFNDRIDRMDVYHVALPVRRPREHGSGPISGEVEVVLCRIETANGVVGWGEAAPWSVFTGTAEAAFAALDRYLRPVVIGANPADIAGIMAKADGLVVRNSEAKAALETALLDCAARAAGVPVWMLLGGRCRETIPMSVSLADPDFEADLDLMARLREEGVNIIKLKTGVNGHGFDVTRLERLRADFPGLDIRVDYNQGLSSHDALRSLRDIEAFDVTFIEQPVPGADIDVMAELTRALDTPILADESVFSVRDVVTAIRGRICDIVSIKIMKSGGPRTGATIAATAAAGGMAAYGGDMFETGIAHLAGIHMIAASPNISLGCEFYQSRWYLAEDLLCEPIPFADGAVHVPDQPGLGISVDEDKVARYVRHRTT